MTDRGDFDWLVAVFAVVFLALIALVTVWAAHAPTEQDRIDHCLERGGVVKLDHRDRYDGCLISSP